MLAVIITRLMWKQGSLKRKNQQICRNVPSAQIFFPVTSSRYTLPHVWKGWLTVSDPINAISQCAGSYLRIHERESPLLLSMDIRESLAEQDMTLISFYKRPNVEWGRPLNCKLEGDTAIGQGVARFFFSTCIEKLSTGFCINFANSNLTRLFEGEPGHLIPSASHFLVESDMFMVAGRMIGHSFLHGGPCLQGLSPAVVHVLLGGSPETATVTLEDCPDLDIRDTIRLLEGGSILSSEDKQRVQDLAYAWDLPSLTDNNRRWLFEKLLIHAVIGRVTRQIKQLRRGLKETSMWKLVTQRPDTVALLFPEDVAGNVSAEVNFSVIFEVNSMVHTLSASITVCYHSCSCYLCLPTYMTSWVSTSYI